MGGRSGIAVFTRQSRRHDGAQTQGLYRSGALWQSGGARLQSRGGRLMVAAWSLRVRRQTWRPSERTAWRATAGWRRTHETRWCSRCAPHRRHTAQRRRRRVSHGEGGARPARRAHREAPGVCPELPRPVRGDRLRGADVEAWEVARQLSLTSHRLVGEGRRRRPRHSPISRETAR